MDDLGWILAQENDDGIAKTFDFASTRNKAVTGPLPRFAHMIHAGDPVRLVVWNSFLCFHMFSYIWEL